jgi:hypothetical protein
MIIPGAVRLAFAWFSLFRAATRHHSCERDSSSFFLGRPLNRKDSEDLRALAQHRVQGAST